MTKSYSVDREDLLQRLESVQAGLARKREVLEQSASFVFKDGEVITYNDEVSCRRKTVFGSKFVGAVRAAPILKLLQNMPEKEVKLEMAESEMIVRGKQGASGIVMEQDILLGVHVVEEPGEWKKLNSKFCDALELTSGCAGKGDLEYDLEYIHIHPKYVEAFDNSQMARYSLKTRFASPTLIRPDSVRTITTYGMVEFSETDSWLHFRNEDGLVVSCRRYEVEYPDLDELIAVEGGYPASLPKGLAEAAKLANTFTEDSRDESIIVQLRPGKVRIRSRGAFGWHRAKKDMPSYKGEALEFMIDPTLLAHIVKKHNDCTISDRHLKVDASPFVYIVSLSDIEEDKNGEKE